MPKDAEKTPVMRLSHEEARRFLALYHFRPTDIAGALERLGTVQYDPLNPLGRNPDLVLQARVPGYRVDDWQEMAYGQRVMYDAWDKQACLVPVEDWPMRALIRERYRPYHDREILQADAEGAAAVLAAIREQGPLSPLEFEDRSRVSEMIHSWYGQTRVKRLMRSLWACGQLVTHHRKNGRHYYDLPERVIPAQHYQAQPLLDEEAFHRWIVRRRFQAAGLLRPNSDAAIWSGCGSRVQCTRAVMELAEAGQLVPVQVGERAEKAWTYYMPASALELLDAPEPEPRLLFLGPLDSLLWDRKATLHLFNFDYVWEVYKPLEQRRWGYYVLPVFYKDRFVARMDARLENKTWNVSRWWWEPDVTPDAEMLAALRLAAQNFRYYLNAAAVNVDESVDPAVRQALLAAC
jgi:uncharacterized protein YcaQ